MSVKKGFHRRIDEKTASEGKRVNIGWAVE